MIHREEKSNHIRVFRRDLPGIHAHGNDLCIAQFLLYHFAPVWSTRCSRLSAYCIGYSFLPRHPEPEVLAVKSCDDTSEVPVFAV